MATKLEKVVKREINVDGQDYVVAISPEGLSVSKKRARSPIVQTEWKRLVGAEPQG